MPTKSLDHRARPFDLSLEKYVEGVRAAVDERARATGDDLELQLEDEPGGDRAQLTVRDAGARTRVVVTLEARDGGTRVVEARVGWRVRLAYQLPTLAPTVLLAFVGAGWGVLAWTQLCLSVLVLLYTRTITYPSLRRVAPLAELFGEIGDEAIVSDPRAPARMLPAAEPLGPVDAALHAAPSTSIEQHQGGEPGRIAGRIRHGDRVVRAPLSERVCAYWELRVSEPALPIGKLRQREPFVIEDASGRLHVSPAEAQISAETDRVVEYRWHELRGSLRDLVSRLYSPSELRARDRRPHAYTLTIEEGVIEEGEEIAVLGHSILQHDPDASFELGGYRAQAQDRRCLVHSARAPLLVSDNPALHERARV